MFEIQFLDLLNEKTFIHALQLMLLQSLKKILKGAQEYFIQTFDVYVLGRKYPYIRRVLSGKISKKFLNPKRLAQLQCAGRIFVGCFMTFERTFTRSDFYFFVSWASIAFDRRNRFPQSYFRRLVFLVGIALVIFFLNQSRFLEREGTSGTIAFFQRTDLLSGLILLIFMSLFTFLSLFSFLIKKRGIRDFLLDSFHDDAMNFLRQLVVLYEFIDKFRYFIFLSNGEDGIVLPKSDIDVDGCQN